MANIKGFNATNVEPAKDFEPMPEGEYVVSIVGSEMVPTNAGTGSYLSLELVVLDDGEYGNRKLWNNLNLDNPSAKAVEISERVLSAICHACAEFSNDPALLEPEDSDDLHDIPMIAKISIESYEKDGVTKYKNEVKSYKTYTGTAPEQATPASKAEGDSAPVKAVEGEVMPRTDHRPATSSTKAPWNRK